MKNRIKRNFICESQISLFQSLKSVSQLIFGTILGLYFTRQLMGQQYMVKQHMAMQRMARQRMERQRMEMQHTVKRTRMVMCCHGIHEKRRRLMPPEHLQRLVNCKLLVLRKVVVSAVALAWPRRRR